MGGNRLSVLIHGQILRGGGWGGGGGAGGPSAFEKSLVANRFWTQLLFEGGPYDPL